MKRVTLSKTKLRILSCGFIYSRIYYGSTDHDIIALTKASPSLNYDFLIKAFRLQQNERELKNVGDTELNFSAIEFIYKQLHSQN